MAYYTPPVDQFPALGNPDYGSGWRKYSELGIHTGHIPDLIRMALDDDLYAAEGPKSWAHIHAWRALAQLRAESAIEPLLTLLHHVDDDDDEWVGEELPEAIGMIGPAAIPALTAYLADSSHGLWARVGACNALGEIGQRHPESRSESVTALTRQLERFSENDPVLNGSLLAELLDLHAVESAPVIERAFAARAVDESIAGDWEDVQIELDLKGGRSTPKPAPPLDELMDLLARALEAPPLSPHPQVDSVIAQMQADRVLKSPGKQKAKKQKKHKKKK